MNDLMHDRSEPVRLVIVDDDALVREGLRLLVGGESGITVVGEASDGLIAQAVIARTRPDVVLMDVRMPRCDGIAATLREMEANPDLAILMLTTFHADDTVLKALRAGARGFLLKDAAPNELLAAVHAAAAGRPALAPAVLERVMHIAATAAEESTLDRERYERLSEREREVATLMGEGRSNAQIAAQLFVSVATVKTHVSRVLEKFEAERRTQVVAAVHRLRGITR